MSRSEELGSPVKREVELLEKSPAKGHEDGEGTEASHMRKG